MVAISNFHSSSSRHSEHPRYSAISPLQLQFILLPSAVNVLRNLACLIDNSSQNKSHDPWLLYLHSFHNVYTSFFFLLKILIQAIHKTRSLALAYSQLFLGRSTPSPFPVFLYSPVEFSAHIQTRRLVYIKVCIHQLYS
jgi:hypothetical protein